MRQFVSSHESIGAAGNVAADADLETVRIREETPKAFRGIVIESGSGDAMLLESLLNGVVNIRFVRCVAVVTYEPARGDACHVVIAPAAKNTPQ
jgi:hypothetical protein